MHVALIGLGMGINVLESRYYDDGEGVGRIILK
jgi:hypothetical protein